MPNWVNNSLSINKKYRDILLDENENLDFSKLIPMPESLNITSGGYQDKAIAIYLYKERNENTKLMDLMRAYENRKEPIPKTLSGFAEYLEEDYKQSFERLKSNPNASKTFLAEREKEMDKFPALCSMGEVYVANKEKYGAYTWYEWRNINWGCKWNASDTNVVENGDLLEIYFSTPWSSPDSWLNKLSEVAPFYLEWVEEQGYHGEIYASEKGVCTENELDFVYFDDGYDEEDEEYEEPNEYEVIIFDKNKECVLTWEEDFDKVSEYEI